MAPIPLKTGAYKARSLIAGAQRCVNLYVEKQQSESDPQGVQKQAEPQVLTTHLPTPGLKMLAQAQPRACWRGFHKASNGKLYGVCGGKLYFIDDRWNLNFLGALRTSGQRKVGMSDNRTTLTVVDGSTSGYDIDLASGAFTYKSDPAFYGADSICYLDTFTIFNRPNTNQFYVSLSNDTAFDPLWLASKTSQNDDIMGVATTKRELYLVGQQTTEVWTSASAANFPFQIVEGALIDYGAVAKYSIVSHGESVFALHRDRNGEALVIEMTHYQALRKSTRALENELASYTNIEQAIGSIYQLGGHIFYRLYFPTDNRTWVFDLTEQEWHEETWSDASGVEHAHRVSCAVNAYGKIIGGDRENGKLYEISLSAYDDDGSPIVRRRGFPHVNNEGKLLEYNSLTLEMDPGNIGADAQVSLRWSNNFGKNWGNPIIKSIGNTGRVNTSVKWNNLGISRNRTFEVFWSGNMLTALNFPYVDAVPCLK